MASRDKNKTLTKKEQSFRRRILKDDEIKVFVGHMREFLGPTFVALSDEYGLSIEDTLRFQSLACRFAEARTAKGLTLKEAAASLKVPKYKLDYIENANIRNISPEITLRYIEFLGLSNWFGRWKKANAELAKRMGLVP
ncbi:MAG: helix-turn-helix domain-containing protein [Nitrospirae bacterium]|nr:helix-turn-helix domain-containing protein [Nitrospirota bacterium]